MTRPDLEPIARATHDPNAGRVAALRALFPEAAAEGERVDFDRLRAALGAAVDDRPERYTFTWAGKRDAIRLLQTPSRATLLPCREESVNFDATRHLFIEGDNLEVLKLLLKPYFGRVKMIYIDPPYNTGNDFIYPDDFSDPLARYLELTGQQDSTGNLLTSNPETSGRYHSAWLSMMYPRLFLARQLLRDDGVIFISIDDNEVHNLRLLMNEIFGEQNFIANIVWKRTVSRAISGKGIAVTHDHILVYGQREQVTINKLEPEDVSRYRNPDGDPRGVYKLQKLERTLEGARPTMTFPIQTPKGEITRIWSVRPETYQQMLEDNRIVFSDSGLPYYKQFLSEFEGVLPDTWWDEKGGYNQAASKELKEIFEDKNVFTSPKPSSLIIEMLKLATDKSGLIMDFFAGSCTTAQAVLELNREDGGNRQFIMVQLPEPTGRHDYPTIADIGKERIRRVIARTQGEANGQLSLDLRAAAEDLGFRVLKLALSHFQPWTGSSEAEPDAYAEQMALFTDPLTGAWAPEAVITEVALREGFGLTCQVETVNAAVYRVTDPDREQSFLISLVDRLDAETVQALDLTPETLFICRDIALTDDLAANLALQCRLKTL